MVVRQRVAMLLMPMRQADSFLHEIDGFDIAMKERHPTQEFADRADNIRDIEVARRDFVQHRGEEEKVVAVDEGDVHVDPSHQRPFELQCGIHPTESTTEDQYTWPTVWHTSLLKT